MSEPHTSESNGACATPVLHTTRSRSPHNALHSPSSASESVIVVYFAHALVIYKTSPMRACVLTQKSEEAPASSVSLLATPMSMLAEIYK